MRVAAFARVFSLFAVSAAVGAGAADAGQPAGLVVVTEEQTREPSFGMLMVCPAHDHGTPEAAERKLRRLSQSTKVPVPTVWICRMQQEEILKQFAPLAQRVVVNPFTLAAQPSPSHHAPWPAVDHPLINRLCHLRRLAEGKLLLACVDLNGEEGLYGDRKASFEEVKWQALAALGANYQGVVWRSGAEAVPYMSRLQHLTASLQKEASAIASATPVSWVKVLAGGDGRAAFVSALRSRDRLFVVLLNPDTMKVARSGQAGRRIQLSLDPADVRARVEIHPPPGVRVTSGTALDGRRVPLTRCATAAHAADLEVRGGGDLIIFRFADSTEQDR